MLVVGRIVGKNGLAAISNASMIGFKMCIRDSSQLLILIDA